MSNKNVLNKKVLLFSMPWSSEPSLAPAVLKSVLIKYGAICDVIDASVYLFNYLRNDNCQSTTMKWAANDFIFTYEFEKVVSQEQMRVLCNQNKKENSTSRLKHRPSKKDIDMILRLRQEIIPRFLESLMNETDFSQYSLVGFSCVFEQTFSSIALAKKIKKKYPELLLVFGGDALVKPVGPALQRVFHEMDIIAYGDGEPVIVPLLEAACGKRKLSDVPNIMYRNEMGEIVESDNKITINLDDSPCPNFDDFFKTSNRIIGRYDLNFPVGPLPIESSRGCSWGQNSHCIFCGLDDSRIKYRVKSGDVLAKQLDQLHKRYGVSSFMFSDNMMPPDYYNNLISQSDAKPKQRSYMYAIRPNLKAKEIKQCADVGVVALRPGIESFSTKVLRRMSKGATAIQNIFTIYTMMRYGLGCAYTFMFGIPGESHEEYDQMFELLPSIRHLIPPSESVPVTLTRNSPLTKAPEKFGLDLPLRMHWRYDMLFSSEYRQLLGINMEDVCLYYENPYTEYNSQMNGVYRLLQEHISKWLNAFYVQKACLTYVETEEGLVICDTRFNSNKKVYKFGRIQKKICKIMLSGVVTDKYIIAMLSKNNKKEIRNALQDLCDARIVINESNLYSWLAFHESVYKPNSIAWGNKNALMEKVMSSASDCSKSL